MIVNTCSFIDSAQEESVDTILESAELREAKNRGQGLIVSGCLPQRFRDELPKLLPEVDAFMGIDQVAQVTEIVQQALRTAERLEGSRRPRVQSPRSRVRSQDSSSARSAEPCARVRGSKLRGTESSTVQPRGLSRRRPLMDVNSAPTLHPGLRHAALPAHAATFRLREDRRGLQSSVQLLHHPADARLASQPRRRRTSCAEARRCSPTA